MQQEYFFNDVRVPKEEFDRLNAEADARIKAWREAPEVKVEEPPKTTKKPPKKQKTRAKPSVSVDQIKDESKTLTKTEQVIKIVSEIGMERREACIKSIESALATSKTNATSYFYNAVRKMKKGN